MKTKLTQKRLRKSLAFHRMNMDSADYARFGHSKGNVDGSSNVSIENNRPAKERFIADWECNKS